MSDESLKPHWFQILLSLADRDLHGAAIMEDVLERTGGEMKLWPGTLYGSLGELDETGLIEETEPPADAPTEGGRRRFYGITGAGRRALADEVARLRSYVDAARRKGIPDQAEPA